MALLIAFNLPISALLADSCNYIDARESKVSGIPGAIRDLCIDGKSINTILDFSGYLQFRKTLNLKHYDASRYIDQIDFPQIRDLKVQVERLSSESFSSDFSNITFMLDTYNHRFGNGTVYDRISIVNAKVRTSLSFLDMIKESDREALLERRTIISLAHAQNQADTLLSDYKARISQALLSTDNFRKDLGTINVKSLR
jgi:hypothetical protein